MEETYIKRLMVGVARRETCRGVEEVNDCYFECGEVLMRGREGLTLKVGQCGWFHSRWSKIQCQALLHGDTSRRVLSSLYKALLERDVVLIKIKLPSYQPPPVLLKWLLRLQALACIRN